MTKTKVNRKVSYRDGVPYIRLSGKYLEKFGFNIGSNFNLVVRENEILLKIEPKEVKDGICK